MALVALLPVRSGAALTPGYEHDVKVFHKVAGEGSRPLPARVAVLIGGKAVGTLVSGPKGGKRFRIADVKRAKVALTRHTGPDARTSLDVARACRANRTERYYVRATAVIDGKVREAFTQSDCRWVVEVMAHGSRGLVRTTFVFED